MGGGGMMMGGGGMMMGGGGMMMGGGGGSCMGSYEAEDALMSSGCIVHANTQSLVHQGFSGTSFVDFVTSADAYIEWTIHSCTGGTASVSFRYALSSGNRPLQLVVNGIDMNVIDMLASGSWATWISSVSVPVNLQPGTNIVRLVAIGSSGANIDAMTVSPMTGGMGMGMGMMMGGGGGVGMGMMMGGGMGMMMGGGGVHWYLDEDGCTSLDVTEDLCLEAVNHLLTDEFSCPCAGQLLTAEMTSAPPGCSVQRHFTNGATAWVA